MIGRKEGNNRTGSRKIARSNTVGRSCFFATLLLLLLLANTPWAGPGKGLEKNPPRIRVIPEYYDFGRVSLREVSYTTTFRVRNAGKSSLEIYHVSTSCGCTTASIDKKIIEPGQSATMIVTFDPNAHAPPKKGKTARQRRSIYIRSNDPVTPEKVIHITATVL